MDRRIRKSRAAIFAAFIELLSKKDFNQITVGEIIERADIGRATFYAHFETKEFLLKELCEELFCHIFDAIEQNEEHHHIFSCDAPNSAVLHLFRHLQKNDNHVLDLLICPNNDVFLKYFKTNLRQLISKQQSLFEGRKNERLPNDFWINHIAATFVETVRWWVENGRKESPEILTEYFYLVV